MNRPAMIGCLAALALAGCNRNSTDENSSANTMSLDDNISTGQLPENAQIETLPPDESSSPDDANSSDDLNEVGNGN